MSAPLAPDMAQIASNQQLLMNAAFGLRHWALVGVALVCAVAFEPLHAESKRSDIVVAETHREVTMLLPIGAA